MSDETDDVRTVNDDEDQTLTTRQVLMALEEMPPLTIYLSGVIAKDGAVDPITIMRLPPAHPCAYLIAISSKESEHAMARCFPDRDTFVMTIGGMPPLAPGGAWWLADETEHGEHLAADIETAVREAAGTALNVDNGFAVLIDYHTNTMAVVNSTAAAVAGAQALDNIARKRARR